MATFNRFLIRAVTALLLSSAAVGALPWLEVGRNTSLPKEPAKVELADEETRIIEGELAGPKEFPHQVRLVITGLGNCGGSIIGKQWILTAAHCVCALNTAFPLPAKNFAVRFGSVNTWDQQLKYVERVIVHPKYLTELDYDFALMKIQGKFSFDDYTKTISLAQSDYAPKGN